MDSDQLIDKKLADDLYKEGRAADKIDKERAEKFTALINHPGWPIYEELLNKRVQLFADAIMRPSGSVDGAIALEWVKGAMSGVLLARDLPSVTIGAMKSGPAPEDGDE